MKKKIEIESFLQFEFVSNPLFSKDGSKIAFQVASADRENNNYKTDLWLYDIKSKTAKALTTDGKAGGYIWLESGKLLYQGKNPDGKAHYYELFLYKKYLFYTCNIVFGSL